MPHPLYRSGQSFRMSRPKRTQPWHVPSKDDIRSKVRPSNAFKILLEVDVVAGERVNSKAHVRIRERRVGDQHRVHGRCARDVQSGGEGLNGKITSRPNAARNGVGADRRVIKVCGI